MLDFTSLPYKLNSDARLYCVVIRNIDTDEVSFASGSEVTTEWLKTTLAGATELILHNGIKFDLIALKLFGVLDYEVGYLDREDKLFGKPIKIVDTLVRSRLLNPDRYGGHGLKAWGIALGEHKGDYTDFSHYNEEMLEYCITPDMRLLGEDLRWKPASEFSVGDDVLGFDENIESGRHGRRYKNANIEIITETDAEVFEVTLESGKVLKVTKEHKFLVSNNSQYAWVETKDLRTKETSPKYYSKLPCLLPVYEQDTSFDAGWMSGMLDGEGCLSNGKQRPHTLSVAQRPTGTLEKLERVFKKFEVNTSKRDVKASTDCISLRVTGGFSEVYRALCLFRPERLLAKVNFDSFGRLEMRGKSFNDGVVSVKSVGVQKILKIQTSARTFMCEGYPMHNCVQDTKVTSLIYKTLADEYNSYEGWWKAEKLENKLADLAVKRETYGFWFNRDLAIKCVEDLAIKMTDLENKVNPILPPKPMNKTTLKKFTPPAIQFKKDRSFSANFLKFVEKHNGILSEDYVEFYGKTYSLPVEQPIKLFEDADISDLDHVKMHLISLGWRPTEWKVRDLTKDTKKQSLTYEKRVETLDRWLNQTFDENKYKDLRLEELSLGWDKDALRRKLVSQLSDDKPVRVPTSPCVRVGVEKELCPNLVKLGSKVDFANDFTLYLTYKHRKSSIAGGDLEDVDYEDEYPNTGFLSMYRTVDGRIPTPAIEIGASCVPASTRLLTWDGYKKIVDVKIGDKVLTHEGTYQVVTDCIDNGVKPTFKVTLSNGMTLTCTANHPFYTTEGWVRCEDLVADNVYVYGEKEVWKDAVGFDGYKVSSWGSVVGKRGFEVKPLTSNISGRPCGIDIYTAPYNKTRKGVGRLVCEAFNGGDSNLEVRHLDGNSWNNNAENLVFGTSAENSTDWKLHGSCGLVAKVVRKLTDEDVSEIKRLVSLDGKRGAHGRVAKTFNVSREHVRDICSGKKRSEILNTTTKFVQSFKTVKVISVEYVCDQPTFDITVEDAHSYVAEGIVVHNTNRYRHIGVCNVARASSIYGKEMRSLFGCGQGMYQFGFDFSSLEARIQGHYILPFNGEELAEQLLASKPNDIHTLNANKLGISRDQAKSISYALMYGASYKKLKSMLGLSDSEAKALYDAYWEAVKPLSDLREEVGKVWKRRGSKYVVGIDGRKINTRSQHSLLNALFQSGGVINAKYTTVFLFEWLEDRGYKCDPFVYQDLDCCGMIEYHDECQLAVKPELVELKKFETEGDYKNFLSSWNGKQLGSETTLRSGKICIAMPSVISEAVQYGIDQAEKHTNLKVALGFEYVVANNWYNCH